MLEQIYAQENLRVKMELRTRTFKRFLIEEGSNNLHIIWDLRCGKFRAEKKGKGIRLPK